MRREAIDLGSRAREGAVRAAACCTTPAGASPVPVSAGALGSGSPVSIERSIAEAGCQKPSHRREQSRGPQHQVKPAGRFCRLGRLARAGPEPGLSRHPLLPAALPLAPAGHRHLAALRAATRQPRLVARADLRSTAPRTKASCRWQVSSC